MTKKPQIKKKLIKVVVSAEEHDVVRLAAALRRTGIAEFARSVVVAEARRLASGIAFPKSTRE